MQIEGGEIPSTDTDSSEERRMRMQHPSPHIARRLRNRERASHYQRLWHERPFRSSVGSDGEEILTELSVQYILSHTQRYLGMSVTQRAEASSPTHTHE